ncbi:hypothetical protein K1X76_12690 [bacterium]|nr:hypothetical protein [bacterium]
MKNITLSAPEILIERARKKAEKEKKSLNTIFRSWLAQYTGFEKERDGYEKLMKRFSYVKPGKKFSRDEMNER